MGVSWTHIDIPKLTPYFLLSTILALINLTIVTVPRYFLHQFIDNIKAKYVNHQDTVQEAEMRQRTPDISQVEANLIKYKLPAMKFGEFQSSMEKGHLEDFLASSSSSCAICLSCIDEGEEIRSLANCSHAYHRECIDAWVDHGHRTCPTCRVRLTALDDDYLLDTL